jgi:4-amino-4-deoxy-L-arabinose transferase-like glycosyltransferase
MVKRFFDGKPLSLTGFLLFFLLAYTWTSPFRDLYGLEIRNALIAREMLENGLSIIPRVLGHYYPDYMPLYFWMETVFSLPAGKVSTLSAVLPSALSAVGLLALTFFLGRCIRSRIGWLSALILATIPPFWLNAGSATIDMLLAFCVTAGILCFYFRDVENDPKIKNVYFFGGCLSLLVSFMVKGPIGIVLPAVSWQGYLLLNRRLKDLIFFSFFMMAVGSACMGMELSFAYGAGGKELVDDIIRMQVTGRLQDVNKPFFYYFISLLEIGGPLWLLIMAAFFVPATAGRAKEEVFKFRKLLFADSINRMAFSWFVGIFTVFSLAATKHSRYLLPLYPAAAIILAVWVEHFLIENSPFRTKWIQYIMIFLSVALLSVGIVFYSLFNSFRFVPLGYMMIWLMSGTSGIALVAGWIKPSYRLIGSTLLLLSIGLSGTDLLITPALSRRASMHAFVTAAEASVDPQLLGIICGLGRDGDALKYIFYSRRSSTAIHIVDSLEKLNSLPESCLLITSCTDKIDSLAGRSILKVAEGNIRSRGLYAYLLGPKKIPVADPLSFSR